jgi:hypothetical protein
VNIPPGEGWTRVECYHDDDERIIFYGGGCACMFRFRVPGGHLYRVQNIATGSYAVAFVPDSRAGLLRRWLSR